MQFFLLMPLIIFFATFKLAYGDENTSDIALASKNDQEVAVESETEDDEELDDEAAKYRWLAPLLYDEIEKRGRKGRNRNQNAGNSSETSAGSSEEEEEVEKDRKPKNPKNKGKKKSKGKKKGKKKNKQLIKITEEGMLKLLINNRRTVIKRSIDGTLENRCKVQSIANYALNKVICSFYN